MQKIPEDILTRFERILIERRTPSFAREKYRTWLRYFLDFRAKYAVPSGRAEQGRAFAEKLRSKSRTAEQIAQAADAVSILFALEREDQKRQRTPEAASEQARETKLAETLSPAKSGPASCADRRSRHPLILARQGPEDSTMSGGA